MSTDTILPKDALGPTIERIRKAGAHYQPPRTDRETDRPYARVLAWYQRMGLRRQLDREQYLTAERLDLEYHLAHDLKHVCGAYGQSRWSGTTDAQSTGDEGPTRRELAYKHVLQAKTLLKGNAWRALEHCIIWDSTAEQIGYAIGKRDWSDRHARRVGIETIRSALDTLHKDWNMSPRPG